MFWGEIFSLFISNLSERSCSVEDNEDRTTQGVARAEALLQSIKTKLYAAG